MITQRSQKMELGTYFGLLVAGLAYLCWATKASLFIISLLSIVLLGLVAVFFYYHHDEAIGSFLNSLRPSVKQDVHYYDDKSYVNYTMRDINQFKQLDSAYGHDMADDGDVPAYGRGCSDFTVDNTAIMHRYKDLFDAQETVGHRDRVHEKSMSFRERSENGKIDRAQSKKKRAVFDIGSFVQDNEDASEGIVAFVDRSATYRMTRIMNDAKKIVTGLMTIEDIKNFYGVKYGEPKKIKETTPVAVPIQKSAEQKPIVTGGLFDTKEKTQITSAPIKVPASKPEKKETTVLGDLKGSLFSTIPSKPDTVQQSSVKPNIKSQSQVGKSQSIQIGGLFDKSTTESAPKKDIRIESMASELPLRSPTSQPKPLIQTTTPQIGIFGHTSASPVQSATLPQTHLAPQARVELERTIPRGPTGSHKVTERELSPNAGLYVELSKKAKESISSQTNVTKDKMSHIKETVSDFFSKICSSVDEDFLYKCQSMIGELDRRKHNEEEYLAFIYEFVTSYILEYMNLMTSNKVKIIYSGVFFQVISIYHAPLLEVIQAIAFRKYGWLKGQKIPVTEDREEYLMSIGFNNFPKIVNRRTCKTTKEYHLKVAAEIAKKEDGGSKFEKFYNRLDFYTLFLFTAISTDLRVQLRGCNSPIANTFLSDWKPTHEHLYFHMPEMILSAVPVKFWPIILRNWMNVGSDIWDSSGQKMFDIVKYFHDSVLPKIDQSITSESAEFDVFDNKNIIRDIRASTIAFREDVLEIMKKGFLKPKDVIFDPDRES